MEQTDSCKRRTGRQDSLKEGEGISQRMYMKDPWTDTRVKIDCGSRGQAGWMGANGGKLGQL